MKHWVICISYIVSLCVMGFPVVVGSEGSSPVKEQTHLGEVYKDCSSISLDDLVERLKSSKAIGFFTKLAIRSDVLDFQSEVVRMREKNTLEMHMQQVKESFDGLLLKIMALLDKDPDLAKHIYLARHTIFKSLLEVKV